MMNKLKVIACLELLRDGVDVDDAQEVVFPCAPASHACAGGEVLLLFIGAHTLSRLSFHDPFGNKV